MPILTIEIVADSPLSPTLVANSIADRVGSIFGSEKGQTWVKVIRTAKGDYAESDTEPSDCPHPVFVNVLMATPPTGDELKQQAQQVCEAIAEICNRDPSIVHIIYEPAAKGRIAFGGKVVE